MERFLFYYGEGHSSSRLLHLRSMLATLLLFAFALGTKAQTYQTYDANTCYSKILIDAKINDFAGNTKPMGFGSYNSETGEITQLQWYTAMEKIEKNKRDLVMDYVAGIVAKSIIEAADYYKDFTWSKPWFKLVENYATSVSVPTTGASLDDLNASKMYFALAELTKTGAKYENSTNYAKAIAQLKNALTGLKAVNDNYSIRSGSTVNYYKDGKNTFDLVDASGNNLSPATTGMNAIGGWYHKATYPNQMWCDSEYMGPALLAQLVSYATSNPSANIGTITGSTEGDWKIVAKQFDITWNYLWNSSDKLLYHAFSATPTALGAHTYTWATGTNGTNTGYWARAIGWYFLALVDVLENMPDNISDNSYTSTQEKLRSRDANIKTRLTSYLTELAAGIWAQKKGNNLWTNVINEAVDTEHSTYATSDIQSNTKNYLEASASAIYIAAYIKAMRLSLLSDGTYKSGIETAYQNYISNFITTDNNIINTCASAGLGGGNVNITSANSTYKENGGKYRNGTADYYTRGYDVTKITSYQEGKPLGAFILASTEYERYMKSNYAPSFIDAASENPTAQTITAGESVTLHAAAMAKPVAKYQWYSYPAAQSSKAMRASATPAGTAIDGANSSDLTVKPEANTYYYCVATNEAGTAQTEPVLVTVSEESNEGSGSETENATSSTIATFEGLSSGSSNTWTATENNGFDIPSITLKQYANIYSAKLAKSASIILNVPEGYTVTSLKITACNTSSSNATEITVNSVDKITININTGEHKEYGVSLTNAVTGANTISITNSGAKELVISKIIVCGYKGTPSSLSVTTQPVGATYDVNAVSVTPLNVVVSATGISSEISYQWYSNTTNSTENGTPIEGATSASYTPSVANAGTTYYYCVATAGDKSVTSEVAAVAVLNKSDIAYTTACGGNSNTWTPAAGGTIALSDLVKSSSTGVYTITSGNEFATLSADGTTLTAVKNGTITLSQAADDTYASGSVDINVAIGSNVAKNGTNAYTVEKDKVYSDGLTVTREDITMTLGNDGFWSKGTAYTAGQNTPKPNSGNIPTSGTYYKFTPAKNGTLAVNVYIGKTDDGNLRPLYVSENGTAIEAKAGELTVGKGETPVAPAVGYYQGEVTFNVKANTDYYVYVNGSKMRFYGFNFTVVASSDNTATFSRGVLDGETLTVTHPESEANSTQTITVTPATGATCTSANGATLSGNTLSYTAPAKGTSLPDITLTVTAENTDIKTYTIKVSTVGDVTTGNAIFSVSELDYFGVLGNNNRKIEKQSVTLTAVDGSEGNVQGQGNGSGAKVQKTAGFTINPKQGYLITKVTLVTSQNNRHFDATPAQAGDIVQDDKTYEYSFNRIGDPITFSNNSGNGIYVTRIIVEYEKSVGTGKTILTASFDKDELTFYEDDTEIPALPVLSVKIGDKVADAGLYTVTYTSSNPNVVTVDANGKLTKTGVGSAVINAEITPKDGNTYAGSEAYYTVTVTSLEEPVVTAHDLNVYNTAGVQPQPVIEVFATENGTPVRISNYYYSLKFEKIEDVTGDIIKSDADGKFVLNGEPGDWHIGSAMMKVTVTPTDEAKQRFHIKETVAEFKVTVVETGDMRLPYFGGVEEGKMQKSNLVNERTFITPVLYGGVDISTGFTFDCSFVDAVGSTTAATPAARLKSGTKKVTSFTGSKEANVTIYSGNSDETVYIHVVAKPNSDYSTQYRQIEKWISVSIQDFQRFMEVSIEPTKQTVPVGTVLDQLDDFTVTVKDEDGKTLSYEDGEYTMKWQSSSPAVASVDRDADGTYKLGRKVRALSGGVTDIKVIVSKGGYSDMGAVCTLTVEDKGMFKVGENTSYGKGDSFTVDGLTLSLGGWMFSDMSDLTKSPWEDYGTTSEKPGIGTAWGKATAANKKPLGFTHNIQMTNMKNARQEYGSNCIPESKNIYDKKLVPQTFELMDPMFNVPCAGAYFALSPMTCGTATVYVRQNGVFEKDTKDNKTTYGYRPQRRVFVMDEQGNFVPSIPKLEYPTNWDMGTDGTVFRCDVLNADVNGKVLSWGGEKNNDVSLYELAGADPSKASADTEKQKVRDYVQSHFIGLKNFSIQEFKNGVYANNVNPDSLQNGLVAKYPNELSARGWSVLSVAPVSYTFDVKPGKTYYIYNFGSKLGLYGFTFRKGNVTEDEFNWSDTKAVTPEPTAERHVAKVNIDRTFKAGVWAACVLPFSMTRQQVNAVFGPCYDNKDENKNGTQILYFDRVENGVIYFRRHAYNTLVAGKPFLIKPKNDAVISSANMGDYPYVTIEATTPQEEWGRTVGNAAGVGTIDTDYTWVSSYNKLAVVKGACYINSDGGLSLYTRDDNAKMNGFRGYLKPKTAQAASKVLKLAYDSNIDGDGTATAIEGLVMDSEGNLLEVPASGIVYNLSGQVVTRDADKLYTLPAGIYIVNGKKYIVR